MPGLSRWLAGLLAVILTSIECVPPACAITPQKPAATLRNGQVIDVRGTLVVVHRGWKQFLLLRTAESYALAPNAAVAEMPVPHPVVHEFGLTLPGQDDRLARLVGRQVRVSAQLQFTPGSPSLWNDTLLWARVVALPGGNYLNPRLPEPGLPLHIERYTATETFRPDAWERSSSARDLGTRKPLNRPNLAGCDPNGDGDVLHCSCSDGFRPYAGTLHGPHGSIPATMTGAFAQFAMGDPAGGPVTAEVECLRLPAPKNGPILRVPAPAASSQAPPEHSTEDRPHP